MSIHYSKDLDNRLAAAEGHIAAIRRIRSARWKAATAAALDEFPDLNRAVTRDREMRAVLGRSPPPEVE